MVYADLRSELSSLALSLTTEQLGVKVPQSPEWSVQDTVAHVVGIVDDILNQRVDGLGTDPWTATQVNKRSGHSIDEIVAEWATLAEAIDAVTSETPFMGVRLGADLVTHLHDVAGAVGATADQFSAGIRIGLERYGPFFCERAAAAELPPIRIVAGFQTWQSAEGEPAVTLTGSAFELLRAFSGRRSLNQVRAMDWTGDSEPYLAVITPYGLPTDNIIE
jgi:uncharacterized protein (TIGR03083 family)